MRIDAFNKVSQLYKTSSAKNTTKKTGTSFSDTLEISKAGKDYQIAKQAVAAAPDVRADKVNDIKQRLAAGTYSIGVKELTDKLVEQYFDETV
ncbi:MAG: hypothetical protein K0S47_769 [Herbinix sp.]|jgi:negative regulator of flagellin synthesis FlgM|nr:hypothetical protein [Herbinix sp.]